MTQQLTTALSSVTVIRIVLTTSTRVSANRPDSGLYGPPVCWSPAGPASPKHGRCGPASSRRPFVSRAPAPCPGKPLRWPNRNRPVPWPRHPTSCRQRPSRPHLRRPLPPPGPPWRASRPWTTVAHLDPRLLSLCLSLHHSRPSSSGCGIRPRRRLATSGARLRRARALVSIQSIAASQVSPRLCLVAAASALLVDRPSRVLSVRHA